MASTHTLTGNVYDLTGATFGATGVRVTVVTNLPAKGALVDKTTNSIHLGGKQASLDPSTGEFTVDLIDTSATDLNVAAGTLEYEVRVEYVNPATRIRSTWTSGWFPFTADANLADITTDVEPLAVQSASEYAAAAAASAAEAEAISGLTGEDAAVAFLVEDSGSATAGALSNTIATEVIARAPKATAHVPLNVPTYDGNPSAGHPDVIYIPEGFGGYKYWMGFTPYPTATRENPSIVASSDGVSWEVPAGLTNPLASNADAVSMGYDYWADTDLVKVGSQLWLYYKGTDTGVTNDIIRQTSTDGVTWSARQVVIVGGEESPAVIVEGTNSYTMFGCRDGQITRRTSTDGVTWTARTFTTRPTLDAIYTPWHIDVCKVDGIYHALVSASTATGGPNPFRLFHWTSTDGLTWEGSTEPAVPLTGSRFDTRGHYRSAIMPAASGHEGRFDVYTTCMDNTRTNHDAAVWRIGLIRDFDFGDGETWAFPEPAEREDVEETDDRMVLAGELIPTLGTPAAGAATGWPARGLLHTANSGLGALFAPLPKSWAHFQLEALIVNTSASASGGVALPTRYEIAGPGDTITTGGFDQVIETMPAQNVPKWIPLRSTSIRVQPNKLDKFIKVTIERSWGNASDVFDDTVWILAVRVRRVRAT